MKKLLFVLILVAGQSLSLPMNALQGANARISFFNRDKWEDEGVARSLAQLPVEAFIDGNELTINFLNLTTNVTITLTNVLTGEVVSSTFFATTEGAVIDLSSEDPGGYQLDLTSAEWSFWGDFSL